MGEVYKKCIKKNRAMLRAIFFLFIGNFMAGIPVAYAQTFNVSGTVLSEEDGQPIPGATVLIKGTSQGTITDIDGNFHLTIEEGQERALIVSFVGYQQQEVPVGDNSELNISLLTDITSLEEVVVIGYGTQKKKVVTGATVQVKGEDLEKRVTTNALQALQGQAAGVSIRTNSGQPGEGLRVNIRGMGTTGNSGPLYIVDGIATGDINYLNNADIASVDVLKDAASAAIYGSRAANGVILITTRKGRSGKAQINFDSYYGLQNRPTNIEMLNAREYAQIINEQHLNSGGTVAGLPFDLANLPAYKQNGSADTDWLDEMFVKNAVTQNYSFGVSGGSEQSAYAISFSYTGQEGIVGGADFSNYDRYNGRINTENKFYNGKLKVGENLTYSYTNKNGISVGNQYSNSLRGAFNVSPLLPVYNDNGDFFNTNDTIITDQVGQTYWNNTESSPYASMVLNNQNKRNEQKLLGNVYAEFEIIKGLKIRSSFGVDFYSDEFRSYSPEYELSIYAVSNYNSVSQSMGRSRAFQFDNYATYDFNVGSHALNVMVGMSSRDFQGSFIYGQNANLVFNDFDRAWLNNATNEEFNLISIDGAPYEDEQEKLLSYFGRLQYNFQERYLLNATFRADGSSRFAKGNRWGFFPSVSAGWVLSDEAFLNTVSFINFLKIRASWGQNGNQSIPAFQYLAPIAFTQATYNFGDTEAVNTPGAYPSRLAYEDLQWETSDQIDVGADLRILSNRVLIAFDWYKKSTIDWLITAPVLGTAGADPPVINGGRVENTGVELELTYASSAGGFNYSISANGNLNENIVKEVPTEDGVIHGAANTLYNNSPEFYQAKTGHPIGYFWGFETEGLFQNSNDVETHTTADGKMIQPNARPGDVRFVDQNGDGILNDSDKVQLGNPNPPVTLGFTFAADYQGFDISIMSYGSFGHQLVQSYRSHTDKFANYTTAILDRWTGEGTSNTVPRVTNSNVNYNLFSDLFIQDGDFLRIGNVTIGYDFAELLNVASISQFRVYAAVNNLYTFTKYTGMDPDIGYGFDNGIQDQFSSGIDLGFYPNPRTALLGVSLKF